MTPAASGQDAGQQPIALLWIWVLAAAWILPGLVGHDPWKPDEAYTFGLVYSMLQNGDWVCRCSRMSRSSKSRRCIT